MLASLRRSGTHTSLPDDDFEQARVDAADSFELAFGRKALIESFGPKFFRQPAPGFKDLHEGLGGFFLLPLSHQLAIHYQVVQHPNQSLERNVAREGVPLIVPPDLAHDLF